MNSVQSWSNNLRHDHL